MDDVLIGLLALLDKAIAAARQQKIMLETTNAHLGLQESAAMSLENLQVLRENAAKGKLPRPSNGAQLGLSRFIGEWLEEGELIDLAYKIDHYYQNKM